MTEEKVMNEQEIFDKVARHLLTQNKKAMNAEQTQCLYRAPDGTMCAVGCLIPDTVYSQYFEGQSVSAILGGYRPLNSSLDFLQDLQSIHDSCEPPTWLIELELLANYNNLNTDILTPFKEKVS